jgi:sugar phosphate isomerase/epimerase
MKILGRTQPLSRYPILACLDVIRRLGFDGVEICLENPDLAPDQLTPGLASMARERVAALGLSPHSVSYHKDFVYDDVEFERTRRAIALTPAFGAQVFVFSGPFRRSGDAAEWARTVERARELARLAEDCGVMLAEEFEPGFVIGSTADLARLFDAVPSGHLAANLDLGHVFLCDPDPLGAIRQLGPRIIHCHIENMRTGVHEHMLPHEGDMKLLDYLRALAETGFSGGLALDLYKHDYEAVAPGAIAYLRRLVAEATGG